MDARAGDATAGTSHPLVDIDTDRRAVVVCDSGVIGRSPALVDAITRVGSTGRVITLRTPPDTRVTVPAYDLIARRLVQWVVQLPDGRCYDGLDGTELRFDEVDYLPVEGGEPVPEFGNVPDAETGWQVIVSMSLEHHADLDPPLGRGVEAIARVLTGAPPLGWGVHEPASEPWEPAALTALVRDRLPETTRLTVVGGLPGRMVLSLSAQATNYGVEEEVNGLAYGGSLEEPLADLASRCVEALAQVVENDTVGFAWAHVRPGRADLTETPTVRSAAVPVALLIGPRAVHALGVDSLQAAPLPPPRVVGARRVPSLLWALGGDTGQAGWDQLADLVTHLTPQRIVSASPPLAAAVGAREPS